MWNKEKALVLTCVLLMCHKSSVFGLGKLGEDDALAQELGMDPMAVVHIEIASAKVVEEAGVDLDIQVPHNRIHRKIDRDSGLHIHLGCDYPRCN